MRTAHKVSNHQHTCVFTECCHQLHNWCIKGGSSLFKNEISWASHVEWCHRAYTQRKAWLPILRTITWQPLCGVNHPCTQGKQLCTLVTEEKKQQLSTLVTQSNKSMIL